MSIESNMAARSAAEEVMGFCREVEQEKRCTIEGWDSARFWAELDGIIIRQECKYVIGMLGGKPKPDVMTDEESKRFGNQLMPFGEFAGRRVDEVPLERLEWYAEQRFTDDLRKYLRSRRIQAETGTTEDV